MLNPKRVFLFRRPHAGLVAAVLCLSGCAEIEGACDLSLAHKDCPLFPGEMTQFPSDDAICRSYGMKVGSLDYDRCRAAKASVQAGTKATINTEWWKNGL